MSIKIKYEGKSDEKFLDKLGSNRGSGSGGSGGSGGGAAGVSSWNDLTDRPFYENVERVTFVDNFTVANGEPADITPKCNFEPGKLYDVIWNGVLYEGLACYSDGEYNCIGGEDYPFYIDDGGNDFYVESNEDGDKAVNYVVSVIGDNIEIRKIDPKYLPEALQFGEEKAFEPIVWDGNTDGHDTMSGDRNGWGIDICKLYDSFIPAENLEKLVIKFNGEIVGEIYGSDEADVTSYGWVISGTCLASNGGLICAPGAEVIPEGLWMFYAPGMPEGIEITILPITTFKTIDPKYLPEDSGGVTSWNDLTDKPFGETAEKVKIVDNLMVYNDFEDSVPDITMVEFNQWKSVDVVFDGATYENIPFNYIEGATDIILGSLVDESYPLGIAVFAEEGYDPGLYFTTNVPGDSHTISIIVSCGETITCIDPKYIKDMYYEKVGMVGGDTLTWDGNVEGHEFVFWERRKRTFVKLSDVLPKFDDAFALTPECSSKDLGWALCKGSGVSSDGSAVTYDELWAHVYYPTDPMINTWGDTTSWFICVEEDSYDVDYDCQLTRGVWFILYENGAHLTSLTVPGANVFMTEGIVVNTIDQKYLPEPLQFYVKSEKTTIVDNFTVVDDNIIGVVGGGGYVPCEFIPGKLYDVIWEGVTYEGLTCYRDGEYACIGGDGYPFYVDDYGSGRFYASSNEGKHSFVVSVMLCEPDIQQIDEKYIPDTIARVSDIPDISIPDPTWETLPDKPFGDDPNWVTLVDNSELAFSDYGTSPTGVSYYGGYFTDISRDVFENSKYLRITWDGQLYELPRYFAYEGSGAMGYYGNVSIYFSDDFEKENMDDTTTPFFAYYMRGYWETGLQFYTADTSSSHTITVEYIDGYTSVPLDEKYIPDTIARVADVKIVNSDWLEFKEDSSAYVKNRTHYDEPVYETWVDELMLEFSKVTSSDKTLYCGWLEDILIKQHHDEYLRVIWDGVPYIAQHAIGIHPTTGSEISYIGNMSIFYDNGVDTGEPFYIEDSRATNPFIDIFTSDTSDTHTLKIECINGYKTVPLDEKYIPDTIARMSDVEALITGAIGGSY